jgi:hypothetical protein
MSQLQDLMLADLKRALNMVRAGQEVVPAWRILTPEQDYVILTRFDPDKPEQREHMLELVPRFMALKMATAFVMTAETWLGPERTRSGEEAVLSIGVSYDKRLAVIRRILRKPGIGPMFEPPQWLPADMIDPDYFRLLPAGTSTLSVEEVAELERVFGPDGELTARPVS